MVFLKGISARIRHEELPAVERYALRLIADLDGIDDIEGGDIDFSHIAFREVFHGAVDLTLMAV